MNVWEVTYRPSGGKHLSLVNGLRWGGAVHTDLSDYTVTPYSGPCVYLVNDRNDRDYYGSTQLVSVHRTYEGAERELERLRKEKGPRSSEANDLELDVDYLRD